MARVLIVEDEADLASLLVYNLKAAGHEASVASSGAAAISAFKSERPELVLLDLMLPDMPGLEVVRFIRETVRSRVPIIIVTARGDEQDRVHGLELGADDYVVKPFSVKELGLRVKAILRHGEAASRGGEEVLTSGPIRLDSARHEVTVDGEQVLLTAMEFKVLKAFLENAGRALSREVLLAQVWGITSEQTTRTVDTHVKRLREKLGAAGAAIETLRGVGYKLVR
ncbi:MAG: response regulator transcription factor [Myxococcaceae bacterium]